MQIHVNRWQQQQLATNHALKAKNVEGRSDVTES